MRCVCYPRASEPSRQQQADCHRSIAHQTHLRFPALIRRQYIFWRSGFGRLNQSAHRNREAQMVRASIESKPNQTTHQLHRFLDLGRATPVDISSVSISAGLADDGLLAEFLDISTLTWALGHTPAPQRTRAACSHGVGAASVLRPRVPPQT